MAIPFATPLGSTALGPILFGYCLDIFLYGILTVQTYLYYLAFPKDRRMTKVIIYFVYIIETLQTALALHDFYTLFCTPKGNHYLDYQSRGIGGWGFLWFTVPVSGALVAFVVQLSYAHRIYVISRVKVVTAIVSMLAFGQLSCGIASSVLIFASPPEFGMIAPGLLILPIGGALGVACDLLIAIYMSLFLSREMKAASRPTQVFVTKVVRLLLETGILAAVIAVASVILPFFTRTGALVPALSLGKIYANSMLVLLNNRFTILGGRNTPHPDFDIASYRRSDLAETNAGPVVSHGIAFAHSRPAETIFSGSAVHTVELDSRLRRVSEELKEMGNKKVEGGDV